MKTIKQLPEKLANMIAAGEVVERPASIVKELIENSIDADAKEILIEIEEFGMRKIKVTDNGKGMSPEDLKMAFFRHATSKIESENDLRSIMSLGFRGEAIPAIASVSKVKMTSKEENNDGYEVLYEAGAFVSERTVSANRGTSVEVTQLFYNVPARLKYVKSERAELDQIILTVERLAMAYPEIRFTLIVDGKETRKTLGEPDPYSLISSLYGPQMTNNLMAFEVEKAKINIEFILLSHQYTRRHKRDINIFVNNRYIQNFLLKDAVVKGYSGKIMVNQYPIAIVKISLDEALVDVNVHPQKLEVKLVNEYFLADLIERSIKEKMQQVNPKIVNPKLPKKFNLDDSNASYVQEELDLRFYDEAKKDESQPKLPNLEYIGILGGTYLLFSNEEGLYLMDQHAAAERVRYELYYQKLGTPDKGVRELLIPMTPNISNLQIEALNTYKDKLEKYDFIIDDSGNLTGIPVWIYEDDVDGALNYLIDHFKKDHFEIDYSEFRDELAKSISCKGAIKANEYINREEVERLVEDLNKCMFPYTCPHGRPTIIQLTYYDIERLFKRVV